jgi:hypothetical protein
LGLLLLENKTTEEWNLKNNITDLYANAKLNSTVRNLMELATKK